MSNSHADLRSAAAALLLLAACATTRPVADPDAPRPALAVTAAKQPRVVSPAPNREAPIEIETATVRAAVEVPEVLARLRRNREDARRLVVIDVQTANDLDDTPRTAYPVIVLNGRDLTDTVVLGPRRLAALVEADAVRRESTVTVTMIGDRSKTSRRAVPLRTP
ncbi:MAG TPA: hypothetical protein VM733_15210 [Thermoanaerobaculia bacterium]|nr:hypothetical protein [Thermoanaerobaculia bacterium]